MDVKRIVLQPLGLLILIVHAIRLFFQRRLPK